MRLSRSVVVLCLVFASYAAAESPADSPDTEPEPLVEVDPRLNYQPPDWTPLLEYEASWCTKTLSSPFGRDGSPYSRGV